MGIDSNNFMDSINFTEFIFDNISAAVFIVDKQLRVQKVNNSYRALFQKEEIDVLNQLCGNSIGCAFAVDEDKPCGETSKCGNCDLRQCVLKGFSDIDNVQQTYVTREFYINEVPVLKYFRVKIKNIKYSGNDFAIITVDDITELEVQKEQIKEMANSDNLTKLHNRRFLYEYGDNVLENAKRGNIILAVVMVDIDFFKMVNDTYGHDAGDFVLKSLSDILKSNLRSADIIVRFGGEEFCILLNIKNPEEAFEVMEKIRKLVAEQKFVYEGKNIPLTISSGVTTTLEKSLDDMIKRADEMLYHAKESGRNRTIVYNEF